MVRGRSDTVYLKLAKRYNALIGDPKGSLPVTDPSDMEKKLFDALYVIEILYDGPDDTITSQGTGFFLDQIGFVTAAHVISDSKGNIYKNIQIRRWDKPNENLALEIKALDTHRDLAFGTLKEADGSVHQPISPFLRAAFPANTKDRVTLMGFPAYKVGQTPYVAETHVASRYVTHAVSKMEITAQIRNGNSGGPVLGKTGRVVGIAVEGADKAGGNNAVVLVKELLSMVAQSTQ
jgi:V8-like Glu-specific endopeptidase